MHISSNLVRTFGILSFPPQGPHPSGSIPLINLAQSTSQVDPAVGQEARGGRTGHQGRGTGTGFAEASGRSMHRRVPRGDRHDFANAEVEDLPSGIG